MNPEKQAELKQHLDAIAKLLYEEADPAELTTLEGIEKNVRAQAQKHVLPQLGFFYQRGDRPAQRKTTHPN
jgi:hypothetical protein